MIISTAVLIAAGLGLVAGIIYSLKGVYDRAGKTHEDVSEKIKEQVHLSETDEKYIKETQELLVEIFGENACERFRNATKFERIEMMHNFAEKLSELYGLDITVDISINQPTNDGIQLGCFSQENNKAEFNIFLLTLDLSDFREPEYFDEIFYMALDTVIHELRHAVQHRAITEEGFWDVDEERRNQWANNMAGNNYIRPEVDMIGYQLQPIEADAVVFAENCLKGVRPE